MKKIMFLVSGNGGTLKFIVEASKLLNTPFEVVAVIADRNCGASDYATQQHIATKIFDFKKDGWQQLSEELQQVQPDIVITTIHKIIPKLVLDLIPDNFINLHYSLLPAFKGFIGMKTVQEAKKKNVQLIGATAHYVNEHVDEGKIISQCVYAVDWNQEITMIYDVIFKNACITLYNALYIIANFETTSGHVEIQHNEKIMYHPPLRFNSQKFNTTFWSKIN
ncbi:phosphoribosylglycinamide formyltransferase [Kordia jejudonensis]|uniref:phosphoribosylglycinamide formyltransferase n=1 Tax=Kordia jejudonensis TaxID=1348245 RepID=UPI0009E18F82|nr:formyltransferase family protein [Kordia jejudonensis]